MNNLHNIFFFKVYFIVSWGMGSMIKCIHKLSDIAILSTLHSSKVTCISTEQCVTVPQLLPNSLST